MGKILIGLICFFCASCCFFMYSSVPPYECSIEWEKIKKNETYEKIQFVLVAPNQDDERIQDFVKKIADILAHSGTSFCKHCLSLSEYSFSYERVDSNEFVKINVDQPQYGICAKENHEPCEVVYRDMYDVSVSDSAWQYGVEHYNWRNETVYYYVPKESKRKKNTLYVVFSIGTDGFSNRYAIWNFEKKTFLVRGMLNSFSLGDDLDEMAKISADVLAIGLDLR